MSDRETQNINEHATEGHQQIFEDRFDSTQSLGTTLSQVFADRFSYDMPEGEVQKVAVVLEVLSGPQVKTDAITKYRPNTTCLNLDEYPNPYLQNRDCNNKGLPVIVKAKMLDLDADLDWPKNWPGDMSDVVRIDAHGTFYQFKDDESLNQISVNSEILVSFNNKNISGRPDGRIIGHISSAIITAAETRISAKKAMNPDCASDVKHAGPEPGFYVGTTDPNPNPDIGPPIRKVKGHIKTGIYGNGTPQTKAHFAEALSKSKNSHHNKIPGPAPGPNNAFIWIGTLKNNGYLDVLDRPLGQGRETIIYAPMTLDLTAPIEIKYYFHDVAGFGHAHLKGPNTTIEEAKSYAASSAENDFRERIGPGIKDLNDNGRNYILVIPEMAYSRGFGTGNGGSGRVNKLSSGEDVMVGKETGTTIRTKMSSVMRAPVENYLNKLPVETTKNVLGITPLVERQFSTFDGTFSGGKFGEFHREVLDVLDEHLGSLYEKIEYISFLADGFGGVALASIVNNVQYSSTHASGRNSFINEFVGKKMRVDYVTNEIWDSSNNYGSFFKNLSPSTIIWENLLLERSEQGYMEFNYIMPSPDSDNNNFFEKMDKLSEYKNSKTGSGRKFSFYTVGNIEGPESFISFHVAPSSAAIEGAMKTAGSRYAFSMVNDFLHGVPPLKPNINVSLKPSYSSVPNHAHALSTKPSRSSIEKILKRRGEIEKRLIYFETFLKAVSAEDDTICEDPQYKMFCKNGGPLVHDHSLFFTFYKKYFDDKRDFQETKLLEYHEKRIQKIINNRNELIKEKNEIENLEAINETLLQEATPAWEDLQKSFIYKKNIFALFLGDSPGDGPLATTASTIASQHAYKKIKTQISSALQPGDDPKLVKKPKDCAPQQVKLGPLIRPEGQVPTPGKSIEPGNSCSNIMIATPNTFKDLASMIPYYPEITDFIFTGKTSKTKTNVHSVPNYKTSKFKYPARGMNGAVTHKESPLLWACITETLQNAWKAACEETNYYPFEITSGIRGLQEPKTTGTTAYKNGVSLHSFGLAFDLDPFIAGYGRPVIKEPKKTITRRPVYSVYTGVWTPGFIDIYAKELWKLGVYHHSPNILKKNAFQDENRPRLVENWQDAPGRYKGRGESGDARQKYIKIMKSAKGGPIVPFGANPTLWIIRFCELSGMKWGNGLFLKKRWNSGSRSGASTWSIAEKNKISNIFGIPNIVDRVQAISWNSRVEDHMHIHYWGNKSLVGWKEIKEAKKEAGL